MACGPATCLIHLSAIFAPGVLNFCVRDGNRCVHSGIVTRPFEGSFLQN